MIPILFIILFSLALFHWAYETAVAPSVRLATRYRLFALRDQLRRFAAREGIQLDYPAIRILEESINCCIEYMPELNFGFVFAFRRRFASDSAFRKRVEHRENVLESYMDPDFRDLRREYARIFREIMLVNSGGWFVYLVPVAAGAVFWDTLRKMFLKLSVLMGDDYQVLARGVTAACAEPA